MNSSIYLLAFATGLFGAGHCLGMCGNLVAALALTGGELCPPLRFQALYHSGRALTYMMIGALAGWFGSAIAYIDMFRDLTRILFVASDLFVIIVGLASSGLYNALNILNIDFGSATPSLTGWVRKLLKYPGTATAFPLGLIFGLLPCGFVYAMAIAAAQTTNAVSGAMLMFCFAVGTAPALLLFGSAAGWLGQRARTWLLRSAGLTIAAIGAINLYRHLQLLGVIP